MPDKQFDPTWFDEKFWKTKTKGVDRDPNHGRYIVTAEQIYKAVGSVLNADSPVLEAGCGQGAVMRHLQALAPQWRISGFDVSKWAVEHKVHENVVRGDVVTHVPQNPVDMVYCIGVLEYLDPDDVPQALRGLALSSMNLVVLGLQPTDHKYMPVEYLKQSGRLTHKDTAWWEKQISDAGLMIDAELTFQLYEGVNKWDGMYVCRV